MDIPIGEILVTHYVWVSNKVAIIMALTLSTAFLFVIYRLLRRKKRNNAAQGGETKHE